MLLTGVPAHDILFFFDCPSLARHGNIDSFLCDCPPATNYKDAEPQDVFNIHLANYNYLAELAHKKEDFFL